MTALERIRQSGADACLVDGVLKLRNVPAELVDELRPLKAQIILELEAEHTRSGKTTDPRGLWRTSKQRTALADLWGAAASMERAGVVPGVARAIMRAAWALDDAGASSWAEYDTVLAMFGREVIDQADAVRDAAHSAVPQGVLFGQALEDVARKILTDVNGSSGSSADNELRDLFG